MINVAEVGRVQMALVSTIQEMSDVSSEDKLCALACLFQVMVSERGNDNLLSTPRKEAWEYLERAQVINNDFRDYPEFRGAREFIKRELN